MTSNTLYIGNELKGNVDERIISNNGLWFLVMQGDGNCVVYPVKNANSEHAMWHTNTARQGATASVTENGAFVIKNSQDRVVFTSGTNLEKSDSYKLIIQNDGNVVMYNGKDAPVWQTKSAKFDRE